MHQTSSTYQKILAGPHRVETVLQVGSNADVAVCWSIPGTVYGADMITKISQKGDILDREAPGIGYFVARKLEVTMLDPGKQVAAMGTPGWFPTTGYRNGYRRACFMWIPAKRRWWTRRPRR